MFQQAIKETVQRANAAIATEGGERVTRRHYGDHELAKVPRGCPVGPGVDDPILLQLRGPLDFRGFGGWPPHDAGRVTWG
jgi:hypothetical protein